MSIYDAAMRYQAENVPLVVFAGAEYGNGSSRDWAAKGTNLLGVRAVIAQSFERIHRSNLVGMGVLPLTFEDGTSWDSLGLKGDETVTIKGLSEGLTGSGKVLLGEKSRPFGQQLINVARTCWAYQLFDKGLELAIGHRAHKPIDRLAIDEGIDGGDRLNPQLTGIGRVLVDINLDQLHRPLGGDDGLFDGGGQGLAGPAPGCPEVDNYRLDLGGLDHIGHETGVGTVLNQAFCRASGFSGGGGG
jgi:hypothetical protein